MYRMAWDAENQAHITGRHGVTREEVEQALHGDRLEFPTVLHASGELRTSILGRTRTGRILFVCYTVRGGWARPVTAYPAKHKLRRLYERHIGGTQ